MTRTLALLWLAAVLLAGGYLTWRAQSGLAFRTDLMALLPMNEQDPVAQRAHEVVTQSLSRRFVLLVGHSDRAVARAAARRISDDLTASGLASLNEAEFDADRIKRIGALYFPYRAGLLSQRDRATLQAGNSQTIATRALSQVFGFVGMGDARMLRTDPFLLLPAFFADLPLPMAGVMPDEGMLSVVRDGTTWVLVVARLTQEPYALDVQKRLTGVLDPAIAELQTGHPGLEALRLGAVFFAQAAAEEAINETSLIGIVSTIGTVIVLVAAFRALTPLLLGLLVIGVGVLTALAGSLWLFGELHVGALLFGVSLIGVAVDYCLQYCTELFTSEPSPWRRLRRVVAGISIGTATTVIGYLTLLLAPFPGLHQLAVFSAIGLVGSWLTVVLWLPYLDRGRPARHGQTMLAGAARFLGFWQPRAVQLVCLAMAIAAAGFGAARFHVDDDIRRMQALSPSLLAQQARLQALIGSEGGGQFFLVTAADAEAALQREEALNQRLERLVATGALTGFRSPAQFVPSVERQRENIGLRARVLGGDVRRDQYRKFGLPAPDEPAGEAPPLLTLAEVMQPNSPLQFMSMLVLEDGGHGAFHLVMLDGVRDPQVLAGAADGLAGVQYVDAAGSFSAVLGKYRARAIALLALSAALMAPLLLWRYGLKRTVWIMLPPLLAVALAPALLAAAGDPFTFFDAIALVLILSVGVDYTVFLAETSAERRAVTMLAVLLAASTALMSFGLLSLSHVQAVHHFGATMLVGILLAALLAPLARR